MMKTYLKAMFKNQDIQSSHRSKCTYSSHTSEFVLHFFSIYNTYKEILYLYVLCLQYKFEATGEWTLSTKSSFAKPHMSLVCVHVNTLKKWRKIKSIIFVVEHNNHIRAFHKIANISNLLIIPFLEEHVSIMVDATQVTCHTLESSMPKKSSI